MLRGGIGREQLGRRKLLAASRRGGPSRRSPPRSPRRGPPPTSALDFFRRLLGRVGVRDSLSRSSPSRHRRRGIDRRHFVGRRLERRARGRRPRSVPTSPFTLALVSPAFHRTGARLLDAGHRDDRRADARQARESDSTRASPPSAPTPQARRTTHAPNAPNQLRHHPRRARPTIRRQRSRQPGDGAEARAPTPREAATTMPAKKIIHERSVSRFESAEQSQRMHRGNERNEHAAGQPKNAHERRGQEIVPTTPTLASTLTPVAHAAAPARARRTPPARKTAKSKSAIPRISRLRVELLTALPLPVWSELGDLSILV